MRKLSNEQIWDAVAVFVVKHKSGIYRMNEKYSWISSTDYEDTLQDIRCHCYNVIRALEEEYGELFDLENPDIYNLMKKRVYGRYRIGNWHNRSDSSIRKSDILNVKPGSDEDICINYYDPDMESFGIHDTGLVSTFNDEEPDAGDYYNAETEADRIIELLLKVLPAENMEAISDNFLGRSAGGCLTHRELAKIYGLERSSVTRRIGSGLKLLSDFCKANNLSLDMPRSELLKKLTDLVAYYRSTQRQKNLPYSKIVEFTIEDYIER